LENSKDLAYLSKQLATINCEVPIDLSLDSMRFSPDWNSILGLFKEYEFNNLHKKYSNRLESGTSSSNPSEPDSTDQSSTKKAADSYVQLLDNLALLDSIIPLLEDGFAIDLETTTLLAVEAQIVGVAISITEGKAYYIPCNDYLSPVQDETMPLFTDRSSADDRFSMNPVLERLKPILESENISKITHHGKYEYEVFKNYGIILRGISFDTMIAAYVLHPGERLGLKELTATHLKCRYDSFF
jgi:DNA polymerase I - 3''-5'' exonuclease and polymerase domains